DDARDAASRPIAIGRRRCGERVGRQRSHARMVVVEDEHVGVRRVARAANPRIARTQVAVRRIRWRRGRRTRHRLAAPRSILSMRGDDHPLFAQRMPPLFPDAVAHHAHFIPTQPISPYTPHFTVHTSFHLHTPHFTYTHLISPASARSSTSARETCGRTRLRLAPP